MKAVTWDPFEELSSLQERLNRIFLDIDRPRACWEVTSSDWTPPADIIDTGKLLVIKLDVPEVDRESIDITMEGSQLTVRGTRTLEQGTDRRQYLKMERGYGTFVRSFPLSGNIDSSEINASIDEGVLRIELPKKEEVRRKQIIIEA